MTGPVTTTGSVKSARPPGRSTRCHSRSTAARSGKWFIESMQTSASKASAANGSGPVASAWRNCTRASSPAAAASCEAVAMPLSLASMPVTRQPCVRAT